MIYLSSSGLWWANDDDGREIGAYVDASAAWAAYDLDLMGQLEGRPRPLPSASASDQQVIRYALEKLGQDFERLAAKAEEGERDAPVVGP